MSRFLKIPDVAFSPWLLHREVRLYVIEEFDTPIDITSYPFGRDAEKLVQSLIDNSTHKFRMYGSAQELMENVKIFVNISESHVFSETVEDPYMKSPVIYYSLKNEPYILKSDLFVILQNMMFRDNSEETLIRLLVLHIKCIESRVGDAVEFVKFDEDVLEDMMKEIKYAMITHIQTEKQAAKLAREMKTLNFDQLMLKFKELSPRSWLGEPGLRCTKLIKEFQENETPDKCYAGVTALYNILGLHIKSINDMIDKRPEMFLPYSATKSHSMPITVRMFEDGDQRFVLTMELSQALLARGLISTPLVVEKNSFTTMPMEHVLRKYDTRNIEFIRTPILRAKHRMVPVKVYNPPGFNFCLLAVDGLFELLREIIFSWKMFQSPLGDTEMLNHTHQIYRHDLTNPFFVSVEGIREPRAIWKMMSRGDVPKTPVRNAKKDGFTVENLKNELAHLGLLKAFPEIQKHADVVYSEVVKKKKEEFLRTCDLFDAVEHCQLICIFEKYPKLKTFLHNQKSCRRVFGLSCATCPEFIPLRSAPESTHRPIQKYFGDSDEENGDHFIMLPKMSDAVPGRRRRAAPESGKASESNLLAPDDKKAPESQIQKTSSSEAPKTSEFKNSNQKTSRAAPESRTSSGEPKILESTQKTFNNAPDVKKVLDAPASKKSESEIQKTSEAPKTPESKFPTQKTSSNASETKNQKRSVLETPETKNPVEKISNPAPDSKTPPESQNQKTSSNCEKCHRVCEMLNETKKELKSTENKLKNLEKKERKIDEFEKNKMENLEREIQKLKGEIEEKEETMAKIKDEKLRQEEAQKVLEEKNSKLEKKLEDEKMKTLEIQKTSQAEILEMNRKLEKFKESEIRMKAENEVNQKMIQQLLDTLGGGGANYSNPSTSSGFWRDSESTSPESRQKCEICWNPTENHQSVKCQKCRRPFHSRCASNWLKSYKMCPSCEGVFQ